MKMFVKYAALGAVLAASAPFAFATPITTGQSVTPTAISAVPGTLVQSTGLQTLNSGTFIATYTETVTRGNSMGANDLNFVIQLTNAGADSIESISEGMTVLGSTFTPFMLDVDYVAAAGDVAPSFVSDTGTTIHFGFQNPTTVSAGSTSDFLVLETNATNFMAGGVSAQDTFSANGPGYVPAAATPEPSSLLLLGSGLLGAAGVMFSRRRAATELL